jgi:predicted metalloprotease with PDZ domain
MKKISQIIIFFTALLVVVSSGLSQQPHTKLTFTLSIDQSNQPNFHVVFRCEGLKDEIHDFKMPAISPGYYRVIDFAKNVENFNVEDGNGNPLPWQKTTKSTWRIAIGQVSALTVSYDVKTDVRSSVASSFIDDKRAYVSPTSIFMYIDGKIHLPVIVTIIPPPSFHKISTGLDPIKGGTRAFSAQNFDILYDCPIYIGNQEIISFKVQEIPHYVAMENPGTFNREEFTGDLKKMIETAVAVIGDIPYQHYTFLFMGQGRGGLEHLNSSAMFAPVSGQRNPALNKRWMSFVAHEYFHLYNVKSIRPIALGPFDYDRENYTHMLWLSEGTTVYYEYIILNRTGLLSRKECLERFSATIARYENNPAHLTQSVADASYNAWTQSFFGGENEISYYDKGLGLSVLLDLKIRYETKNKRSLDDVMRTCYIQFYEEKKRGFTDQEFRQVCENIAGTSLSDLFHYIYSTEEIDYPKYFAYAGLGIEMHKNKDEKGTFTITPVPNPTSEQLATLEGWLKE